MEGVATLMSMELSGMICSLTDPDINVLWSSEIRKIIVCSLIKKIIVILVRNPMTKIPKQIFREFNRIDFFGLNLQSRNRTTFLSSSASA